MQALPATFLSVLVFLLPVALWSSVTERRPATSHNHLYLVNDTNTATTSVAEVKDAMVSKSPTTTAMDKGQAVGSVAGALDDGAAASEVDRPEEIVGSFEGPSSTARGTDRPDGMANQKAPLITDLENTTQTSSALQSSEVRPIADQANAEMTPTRPTEVRLGPDQTPAEASRPPGVAGGRRRAVSGRSGLSPREERSPDSSSDSEESGAMPSDRQWEVFIGGCILANGLGVYLVLLIKGLVFRAKYRRLRKHGRRRRHRRRAADSGSGSGSRSGSKASSSRSGSSRGSKNKDSLVVSIKNALIKPSKKSSVASTKAKKDKKSKEKAKKK